MSTSIEAKLFAAASANSGLQALLGSAPYRWFNTQLYEGSAYPAITILVVSDVPLYANVVRNRFSKARVQFTIWEGQTPDTSETALNALRSFLDTFSPTISGATGPTSFSQIVNIRRGFYAETQPGIYQKIVDAFIWNDDTL